MTYDKSYWMRKVLRFYWIETYATGEEGGSEESMAEVKFSRGRGWGFFTVGIYGHYQDIPTGSGGENWQVQQLWRQRSAQAQPRINWTQMPHPPLVISMILDKHPRATVGRSWQSVEHRD